MKGRLYRKAQLKYLGYKMAHKHDKARVAEGNNGEPA